ncbi:MAG: hypothetical protein QM572_00105 [Nocardioides sp.]|uniref:hypothetical protein n=1 Tax=Nocardioides sp. TaxID=35761 RepID=UPI0039E62C1F
MTSDVTRSWTLAGGGSLFTYTWRWQARRREGRYAWRAEEGFELLRSDPGAFYDIALAHDPHG